MWLGMRNTGIFVTAFSVVGASAYLILVWGINKYTLPDWAVTLDYFWVTVVSAMLLWWVYSALGKSRHAWSADSSEERAQDPDITGSDRITPGRVDARLTRALPAVNDSQAGLWCDSGLRTRVDFVQRALFEEPENLGAWRTESRLRLLQYQCKELRAVQQHLRIFSQILRNQVAP